MAASDTDQTPHPETLPRLLGRTPVFACLTGDELSLITGSAQLRRYEKGATIALAGQPWPHALMVVRGSVRMVKQSPAGRVLAAVVLGPGEVFFGHTLFDDEPLPASLEAEAPSEVYLWDGRAVMALVRRNPAALWEVARTLARQMRRAAEVIDTLAFQPLAGRLARLLLDRYGVSTPEPAPRSMTLDEMAARLGTTREVVCRLLYRLADEGLVSITRTELRLLDRGRLAEIAGDGPTA